MSKIIMLFLMLMLFCCVTVSASDVIVVSRTAKVNQSFDVVVLCRPTGFIKSFECKLRFDNSILKANSVDEGRFFGELDVFGSPHMGIINNSNGEIKNIYEVVMGQGNVTSDGVLFTVNFTALRNGSSSIELIKFGMTNESMYLPVEVWNGLVTVDGVLSESDGSPSQDESPKDDFLPGDDNKPDADEKNDDGNEHTNPLTDMTSILIMVLISLFVVIVFLKRIVF
jgi:hypothetical protein